METYELLPCIKIENMTEILLIKIIIIVAAIGLVLTLARHRIFRMFHSPAEVCERYGHVPGEMRETSGRGRFGTCERCGEHLHEPEYS